MTMYRFLVVVVVLLVGSAAFVACPPPPPEQCTSALNGGSSNLGAYDDPNISNSNGFNTYVSNNVWNPKPGTTATICGPADENGPTSPMHVTTKTTISGGEVVSYPNVQQLTNNFGNGSQSFPIDTSTQIMSSYSLTGPPLSNSGEWEAAYDIWTSGHYDELMVWTQTSAALIADSYGGATKEVDNVTIGGINYAFWEYGGGLPILVRKDQANSGTVNLRAVLLWWKTVNIHGKPPTSTDPAVVTAGTRMGQLDFGWEVRGLHGLTETFRLNSYSLTLH